MARATGATVSNLLDQLAFAGIARPSALRGALGGVSPQTLGRLVAEAGEGVLRIGRARATQYARTRTVDGVGRSAPAYRVDEAGQVRKDGMLRLLWGGRTYWERGASGQLFEGLPPELVDMAPQGFMGRNFSARFPELRVPPRLTDWSDDHRIIAVARRGEDCVGDLVIGDESLERFLSHSLVDVPRQQFGECAARSATELVGSSAGGERPKFGVYSNGRHVLVKFATQAATDVARRWRDLLWCESKAQETIAASGRPASRSRCFDEGGWRFLEVERFDRVGDRGRRAVVSLFALSNEYLTSPDSWTTATPLLRPPPFSLPQKDAGLLLWLDVFGQLIGNTDRHLGNISFLAARDGSLRLAPAYDMLPMILAPSADVVVPRRFEASPPNARTFEIWADAAGWAQRFWGEVRDHEGLASEVRRFAGEAISEISRVAGRLATPPRPVTA